MIAFLRSLLILALYHRIFVEPGGYPNSAAKVLQLVDEQLEKAKHFSEMNPSPLPFTTISYAQTLDGSIAPLTKDRMNISSTFSIQLLHSLRSRHDAILVGINTIICDQPLLNVRNPLPGVSLLSPRPIIIDSNLRISTLAKIRVQNPIICTKLNDTDERWVIAMEKLKEYCNGGSILTCSFQDDGRCNLHDCFRKLKSKYEINSILVEGGASILQSVFEEKLADQIVLTLRPCFLGGFRSLTRQLPEVMALSDITAASIGGDIILHAKLNKITSSSSSSSNCNDDKGSCCHNNLNGDFTNFLKTESSPHEVPYKSVDDGDRDDVVFLPQL